MKISIPELSVVVLIGPSGAGKSSLARKLFRPTEVISSDQCRGLVADDENDQSATDAAFEILRAIAQKRLERGRLCVIDATNVRREDRAAWVELAREHHALPVAIVLDLPARVCIERNRRRPDRAFGPRVVIGQRLALRRTVRGLQREGFRYVHRLESPAEADALEIERTRLWTDKREERGPFDVIGDAHGCSDDLSDPESEAAAARWWEELTEAGGEGMVVKPLEFAARDRRGLVQPAVKCRGREYLRIIYGPDYDDPAHLERLRARGLGAKRSLALREFALGLEALERFARREPLRRVHECVFGVLALESEPVDPRL
jgi:predicted kinase